MGSTHVAFVLLLEERNLTEVGTLQPSLGFKDFHQAARLHSLASRIVIILAGEEGKASRGLPPRGLATRFFLRHPGEETILQLCGGGVL
jgi:hypothetical protein